MGCVLGTAWIRWQLLTFIGLHMRMFAGMRSYGKQTQTAAKYSPKYLLEMYFSCVRVKKRLIQTASPPRNISLASAVCYQETVHSMYDEFDDSSETLPDMQYVHTRK